MASGRLVDGADQLIGWYEALHAETDPARQMGWTDRRQQLLACELLTQVADLSTTSVLDVGCGFGQLYAMLRAQGFHGHYTGVDLVADSIATAQASYPDAHWLTGDVLTLDLPDHDYVLASGLFDVRTADSPARLRTTLARLCALARRGVAWNAFTTPLASDSPHGYGEPLEAYAALCATLTPWFTLRHDYAPNHVTCYLYQRAHLLTPALEAVIGRAYLDPEYRRTLAHSPLSAARAAGITLQQLALLEPILTD